MKKKHLFMIIVVFFGMAMAGQVVSELTGWVPALYVACLFGAMVWAIVWFVTNKRVNTWFAAQIRAFVRHLRG